MATDDQASNIDLVLEMRLMTLDSSASLRKVRLFCCACTRRVWKLLTNDYRQAVEVAEKVSDSQVPDTNIGQLYSSLEAIRTNNFRRKCACRAAAWSIHPTMNAGSIARSVASSASQAASDREKERSSQLALLNDIFRDLPNGNLRDNFLQSWVTSNVAAIAKSAYDDRPLPSGQINSDRLKVLADALEDAGCEEQNILNHCRNEGVHVRGCWVLDMILGKI